MVIVGAVVVGILLWSGFAPLEFALGPWVAVFLLFRILIYRNLAERLVIVFLSGLVFYLPLLHWSGIYVGSLPWLSLGILQSSLFMLLGLIPIRRNIESAFLFSATFVLVEIMRMKFPFGGFGWGRVGHTQVDLLAYAYPMVGVAGVTFLVTFSASALGAWRRTSFFVFPILIFAALSAQFFPQKPLPSGSLRILAVQGGVDQLGLQFNARALAVLNRHVDATIRFFSEDKLDAIDLVIWPENAADIDPISDRRARTLLENLSSKIATPLLVGAVTQSRSGPQNASILYDAKGVIATKYIKQDLAPFGEYMPMRKVAEFVSPEANRVRDFIPGTAWTYHQIKGKTFASLICFEVLDDDFVRKGLTNTDFVVVQTNNATFGKSPQAAQQLQIIRARAAESGKDFAAVSTTGFSAHIDRHGKILEEAGQFQQTFLPMSVEIHEGRTQAMRLGSWVWLVIFLIAAAVRLRRVFSR